jgi:hypothetical protein
MEARKKAQQINFVYRLKSNAVYQITETTFVQDLQDGKAGVLKEQNIKQRYSDKKRGGGFYEQKFKAQIICHIDKLFALFTVYPIW